LRVRSQLTIVDEQRSLHHAKGHDHHVVVTQSQACG